MYHPIHSDIFIGDYHINSPIAYTNKRGVIVMNTRIRQHETGKINIILHDDREANHPTNKTLMMQQNEDLQRIDDAFSSFIGLHDFKEQMKEMYAIRLMQAKREELGLAVPKQ